MRCCPYVPTCPSSLATALALAFLTLPASRFVTTVVFINTKSLKPMLSGAKPQLIGSTVSSSIWWSTSALSLLNFTLTPGNTDDRQPVPQLLQRLIGKVFADKGYISQTLAEKLLKTAGIQLITKLRRNMKNRLLPLSDRLLLRRRSIIESVIDQLKNISQIEHSRHRSPVNFLVNLVCGLIAYCHQPKKPSLVIEQNLLYQA